MENLVTQLFFKTALIGYLVKILNEKDNEKQYGRTFIQKMIFILTRENVKDIPDFNYILYHYGPYSFEVDGELQAAVERGIINMEWQIDEGYYIKPLSSNLSIELDKLNLLSDVQKRTIDDLVEKYYKFNAKELSIIATALFLKDKSPKEKDLVESIKKIKRNIPKKAIENALQKAGIIKEVI